MLEKLNKYLSKADADYADIRYEKMTKTEIVYNGKELSEMGEICLFFMFAERLSKSSIRGVIFVETKIS